MPRNKTASSSDDQSGPTSASNSATGTLAPQNGPPSSSHGSKILLYAIIAVVIVIAVIGVIILVSSLGGVSLSGPSTIGTTNGIPVYMSYEQGAALLGPVSNYSTSDLFNSSAQILNISLIESIAPTAVGNVTEGWGTFMQSQNATRNASIEFFVMKGYNTSELAGSMASSLSDYFATPPQTSYGTQNGLAYTSEIYRNGTSNYQIVSGWKGNYTELTIMVSNPIFSANQTSLIDLSANDTP